MANEKKLFFRNVECGRWYIDDYRLFWADEEPNEGGIHVRFKIYRKTLDDCFLPPDSTILNPDFEPERRFRSNRNKIECIALEKYSTIELTPEEKKRRKDHGKVYIEICDEDCRSERC